MNAIADLYARTVKLCAAPMAEGIMLLIVRVALAGVFWRSGRTKVDEHSWFTLSDNARTLFQEEYASVPLPSELAAWLALFAEHAFPALLVAGLLTRISALALLVMTLVIQIFVYPEAWWQVHIIWVALAMVSIVRGGGILSLDQIWAARK
jgi:putative oxidoreductase